MPEESKYSINVRKEPRGGNDTHPFVLYNGKAIAGDRLRKGSKKGNEWPMKRDEDSLLPNSDCAWNRFRTMGEAFHAAEKLQEYLDKSEASRAKEEKQK